MDLSGCFVDKEQQTEQEVLQATRGELARHIAEGLVGINGFLQRTCKPFDFASYEVAVAAALKFVTTLKGFKVDGQALCNGTGDTWQRDTLLRFQPAAHCFLVRQLTADVRRAFKNTKSLVAAGALGTLVETMAPQPKSEDIDEAVSKLLKALPPTKIDLDCDNEIALKIVTAQGWSLLAASVCAVGPAFTSHGVTALGLALHSSDDDPHRSENIELVNAAALRQFELLLTDAARYQLVIKTNDKVSYACQMALRDLGASVPNLKLLAESFAKVVLAIHSGDKAKYLAQVGLGIAAQISVAVLSACVDVQDKILETVEKQGNLVGEMDIEGMIEKADLIDDALAKKLRELVASKKSKDFKKTYKLYLACEGVPEEMLLVMESTFNLPHSLMFPFALQPYRDQLAKQGVVNARRLYGTLAVVQSKFREKKDGEDRMDLLEQAKSCVDELGIELKPKIAILLNAA